MKKIKADDIRTGLIPLSLFKNPFKWWSAKKYRQAHKRLHNQSPLFYTTSPALLEGIIKAIDIQVEKKLLGGYYEFGVFKGFSLWFTSMYAKYRKASLDFYGFDSFEGLPKSKTDGTKPAFGKGHYTSSFKSVINKFKELDVTGIKLFKGFYSKKLFAHIEAENEFMFSPVSICLIDVDIYESCVEVLEFIKDKLIPGSIILFDDYNVFLKSNRHSERKAFKEFKKKYPNFKFKHIFSFGWHGEAFRVVKT